MALWQVKFVILPRPLVGDTDEVPEETFLRYVDEVDGSLPAFSLPDDYPMQLEALLPPKKGWSPAMETWGDDKSDDFEIWREDGKISSIGVRIDVRKLDDDLLSRLLTLVERWDCVLVEARYRKVCRMDLQQFRALIVGHPHSRAMKDPTAWLPVLADEVKRNEKEA